MQVEQRYGYPVGEMESDSKTILIYETPAGELIETYDEAGICIESDAGKLSGVAPLIDVGLTTDKVTSHAPQAIELRDDLGDAAPKELGSMDGPDSGEMMGARAEAILLAELKGVIPLKLILLLVASGIGFAVVWVRRKERVANTRSSTDEEIASFCEFLEQRKAEEARGASQQDLERSSDKIHHPAA
jgi:hypothetical protein